MLIDNDGCIAGNIARDFFLALFINEASEPPYINVVTIAHVALDDREKRFYSVCYIGFVDACIDTDLVDDVCFGHRGKG